MLTLHHDRSRRYFCGYREWVCTFQEAEILVAARGPHSTVLAADGMLTTKAAGALVNAAIRESERPGVRLLYLVFISLNGDLNELTLIANGLDQISDRVAKVAFLHAACGPALYLASKCDLRFAPGDGIIGHLECWGPDGRLEPELMASMSAHLAHQMPEVSPETWRRIASNGISGEEAEARGLVGGLWRSAFELAELREGEGVEAC